MSGSPLLGTIGRISYRRRWLALGGWLLMVAFLIVAWNRFGAQPDNNFTSTDPGTALINQHFPRQSGDALTLAIRSARPVASTEVRSRVTGELTSLAHAPHVTAVGGPVVDLAETPHGGSSEGVGVAAAAIVLLISFGSVLAMGLPIVTALFGIGSGLALIALIGHLVPAPSFAPVIASLIGLGVGVDYALFIVTRFREALRGESGGLPPGPAQRSGATPQAAVVTAFSTAGRAVLFAGTTVIIAMLGLLVLRQPLMNGVAIAASATVACVLLGSLTLLPARRGFTGTRRAKPSRL